MGKALRPGSRKVDRAVTKNRRRRLLKPQPAVIVITLPRGRSKRIADRKASGADKPVPHFISGPDFGPSTRKTGGTRMHVQLGPAAGLSSAYGSKPRANTPSVMRDLLGSGDYAHFGWIAGHLLNDNLGGHGVARNLTPLTTLGNKNHLGTCETFIKNHLTLCDKRSWANKQDTHWYGVEYTVEVGGDKWDADDDLLQHVATELRVWVKSIRIAKADDMVSDTPTSDPLYFAPLVNVAVDNAGYDLI